MQTLPTHLIWQVKTDKQFPLVLEKSNVVCFSSIKTMSLKELQIIKPTFPNVFCLQIKSYRAFIIAEQQPLVLWQPVHAGARRHDFSTLSLDSVWDPKLFFPTLSKHDKELTQALTSSILLPKTPGGAFAVHPIRYFSLHLSITSHFVLSSFIALPCFYILQRDSSAGTGRAFTAATKALRYC